MVEITGDGFLASFSSAVKAVECAVATQKRLAEEGTRRAGAQRIRLRIGIHVGDVLRESGKLRGDPVNIAARLQQICPPGGILVSESVVDAAKGRLRARAVRVGRRRVKNIRQPVTVFRIIP
jgi:class 3 adenylate cyclase